MPEPGRQEGDSSPKVSRRIFLVGAGLVGSAGLVLASGRIAAPIVAATDGAEGEEAQSGPDVQGAGGGAEGSQGERVTIKAVYFQMSDGVTVSNEYHELRSPATLKALLMSVSSRHPGFFAMLPAMQVLRDGLPVRADASLRDGDEVDFILRTAGG